MLVTLGRRYSQARLAFSGGQAGCSARGSSEAAVVNQVFRGMGADLERVIVEDQPRNTFKNVRYSKDLRDCEPRHQHPWRPLRPTALFEEVDKDIRIMAALAVPSPVERDHLIRLAARAELVRQMLEPLTGVAERDNEPSQLPAQRLDPRLEVSVTDSRAHGPSPAST